MSFNPVTLLQERQCAPIYDDIDTGRNSAAVKRCDELLTQQPNLHLASSLKSIALYRQGKKKEASKVVDKLIDLPANALNSSILAPLCMTLQSLGRDQDEADLLEKYSKAQPGSIEWSKKACTSFIRTQQWQKVQQTALKIHKTVSTKKGADDLYFWWSMQAYCLIADDSSLMGHALALPLAHRMITKQLETTPLGSNSDEALYLSARIMQKEGEKAWQEALTLLNENETGKSLCAKSLSLQALRNELRQSTGQWNVINTEAIKSLDDGIRNWQAVEAAVESALAMAEKTSKPASIRFVEEKFLKLARQDKRDRTTRLAPLYLLKQTIEKQQQSALQSVNFVQLFTSYFDDFKGKGCAYEDLEVYLPLASEQEKETLLQKLDEEETKLQSDKPMLSLDELYAILNIAKLKRAMQDVITIDAASEEALALIYANLYARSLPMSKDLPKTEMQPGDDFALLTVQALINASSIRRRRGEKGWQDFLFLASTLLKEGLKHSPKAYKLRILQVRLLLQFGSIDQARKQFDCLGIKAVQYDTLGWILAHRYAHSTLLLPPSSEEERQWLINMRQMRNVWQEGRTQVPEMVCRAMEHGTFSRVEELILFGKKLTGSIARWLHTIEAARLELMNINSGIDEVIIKNEIQEAQQKVLAKKIYDQRDKSVVLNLLPPKEDDIIVQTEITSTASEPNEAFVRAMLSALSQTNLSSKKDGEEKSKLDLNYDESGISADEKDLVSIAKSLKDQKSSEEVLQHFKDIIRRISVPNQLPSSTLHSACIAFEALRLIQSQGGGSSISDEVKKSLSHVCDALQVYEKPASSANLSDEWLNVLQRIQDVGKNENSKDSVSTPSLTLQESTQDILLGTQTAVDSLISRIGAVLK
ncbi:hypothetical protein L7F22_039310 [Adiantum nelumboides]|nr:hypothetical protein [Adiantum nelumboides]